MITIRVLREIGSSPVPDREVSVNTSTGAKDSRTNRNGDANFDLPGGKDYSVYVDGKRVYKGAIVGGQIVYI